MQPNFRNRAVIQDLLHQLSNGASMPWPHLSCLLDAIDETGYWIDQAKSFTDWLKHNAVKFHLKESTLWRYLVVGRYYCDLRKQFARVKLENPPLEDLPGHVSPEKLELLSKLARVAPRDFFEPVIGMVLKNEITRDELRDRWRAFRPALRGKTARGRGVLPPLINMKNQGEYRSVLEAMVINALQASGPHWLGSDRAFMYEVKMHVKPDYSDASARMIRYIFDAVALFKRDRFAQMQIHGIEIGPLFSHRTERLYEMAGHCDFLWIVTHREHRSLSNRVNIPDFIGLLDAEDGNITVVREPSRCETNCEDFSALLKGLLIKEKRT